MPPFTLCVAPQLLQATDEGTVKIIDSVEIDQTRRRLFGFTLPKVPIFSGDDGAELDLLESTITSVRGVGRGIWHLRIAEGNTLWRVESNSVSMRAPKVGDTVIFKSATVGTYFVRISGRKGVRGSRIQ